MLRSLRFAAAAFLVAGSLAAKGQGTPRSPQANTDPSAPLPQATQPALSSDSAGAASAASAAGAAGAADARRIPRTDAATVGILAPGKRNSPNAPPVPPPTAQNKALMIVGGAAMAIGVVVLSGSSDQAGSLIALGGAVVFLFGLYKYLE